MEIAPRELQNFYRSGVLGLRALQDRGLGAQRFTPDELGHRLSVQPVSIEALLLKAMEAVVAENEVDLPTVFVTDRAGPLGAEWLNLKTLMEQAAERALADRRAHTGPLVLTDPGLLARYGLARFLKQLVDHARQDASPAVFLLVPSAEDARGGIRIPHPAGDLPIPLTSPTQHLRVPLSWLENLDRGQRKIPSGGPR